MTESVPGSRLCNWDGNGGTVKMKTAGLRRPLREKERFLAPDYFTSKVRIIGLWSDGIVPLLLRVSMISAFFSTRLVAPFE